MIVVYKKKQEKNAMNLIDKKGVNKEDKFCLLYNDDDDKQKNNTKHCTWGVNDREQIRVSFWKVV